MELVAEIDRLEVQIEAEAKDANAQLDKMLEKLVKSCMIEEIV